MPQSTKTWLGLVLHDSTHSCPHCRRPIKANSLAIADSTGESHHIPCASSLGWSPSDTEAITMALYSTASTEVH